MKHKEQSEYVVRTRRQYETSRTRALKIKTTLQHKLKLGDSMLETGYSRRRIYNLSQFSTFYVFGLHSANNLCGSFFCK